MSNPPFTVAVTEQSDGVVVRVSGELDIVTAPVLTRHLDSVVASGGTTVVIDLAETTFLDARGVGVLVSTREKVAAGGGRLVLRRPPPQVRRVLEVVGQLGRIPIEEE